MDHLLLISIECRAAPPVTPYAVWATTPDVHAGHRRTDIERIAGEAALLQRLAELAPPARRPPAAVVREGAATTVPDLDPAPAAGGGRRAA